MDEREKQTITKDDVGVLDMSDADAAKDSKVPEEDKDSEIESTDDDDDDDEDDSSDDFEGSDDKD